MSTKIITNHNWRFLKYSNEVPQSILDEYDWLDDDDKTDGWIHYRKRWYHISDFMRVDSHNPFFNMYHGYMSDSFFSGVLVKLSEDGESYQIATYIS